MNSFVDNTQLSEPGQFTLTTSPDGVSTGTVTMNDGRTATVSRDLSSLTDFGFVELLLQVETYQPDSAFQEDFAEGQTFTFTDLEVARVPTPGGLALLALGLAGIAARSLPSRR